MAFYEPKSLSQTIFNQAVGTKFCNIYIMDVKTNLTLFGFDPKILNMTCTDVHCYIIKQKSLLRKQLH